MSLLSRLDMASKRGEGHRSSFLIRADMESNLGEGQPDSTVYADSPNNSAFVGTRILNRTGVCAGDGGVS